jgi:hypothetical protein
MLLELAPYCDKLTDITAIDKWALAAWREQWRPAMPHGKPWTDWNWQAEADGWQKRHVDRFEVAIWSNDQLCGMAIGKPSAARNNLSIYLLQGHPLANHALKGALLGVILDIAEAYGTALNCRELRLVKPLGGALPLYQKAGFRLEKPKSVAPYCVRSI